MSIEVQAVRMILNLFNWSCVELGGRRSDSERPRPLIELV